MSLGVGQHLDKTRGCKIPLVVFPSLVFEQGVFSEGSGDNERLFGENLFKGFPIWRSHIQIFGMQKKIGRKVISSLRKSKE